MNDGCAYVHMVGWINHRNLTGTWIMDVCMDREIDTWMDRWMDR